MAVSKKFYLVDVFGRRKYSGNQLAVVTGSEDLTAEQMQVIAQELNFSETAFVFEKPDLNTAAYSVRIFTPKNEVPFAGHPALGAAYIIREKIIQREIQEVTIKLPVGLISITFNSMDLRAWVTQMPPTFSGDWCISDLTRVLQIDESDVDARWPVSTVDTGFPHIIIPLRSLAALKRIQLDKFEYLNFTEDHQVKSILCFSPEPYESGQQLSVRVFSPHYSVVEDAATGSGNGCLAAYLSHIKYFGSTDVEIDVGQGYEIGRPSSLSLRATRVSGEIKVDVGGRVYEVADGVWHC